MGFRHPALGGKQRPLVCSLSRHGGPQECASKAFSTTKA